jgi:hypothetical protein
LLKPSNDSSGVKHYSRLPMASKSRLPLTFLPWVGRRSIS